MAKVTKVQMRKNLWALIEKSKGGKAYCPVREQYNNLEILLSRMSLEEIEAYYQEWNKLEAELAKNRNFNSLHVGYGGFIDGGDDTFYIDFAGWFIGQGQELCNQLRLHGRERVHAYLQHFNVPESDVYYESLVYALTRPLNAHLYKD